MIHKEKILLSAFIVLLSSVMWSQVDTSHVRSELNPSQDSDSISHIVMNADTMNHISIDGLDFDTLIHEVVLTQDSLVMFCDKAIVINQIDAKAYSNVVIVHHDTIQIYSDSMLYDGVNKVADLYGEVILQEDERRLYTTALTYDVKSKTAEYLNGGTLIDDIDTIVSREGYYYQNEEKVFLKGNVSFVDTSRTLLTDSIIYLYSRDQLNIIAPTQIIQDSIEIYCEGGIYRLKQDRGVLSQNVQVSSGGQYITSGILDINGVEDTYTFMINPVLKDSSGTAAGDTIIFFSEEDVIEIRGNATYKSDEELLRAPIIRYNMNTKEYSTLGRAKVVNDQTDIEANDIRSESDGSTRLEGDVVIVDKESGVKIESQSAIKNGDITKMFSSKGERPKLAYELSSDTLLLRADTLITQQEPFTADSSIAHTPFSAKGRVNWKSGSTYSSAGHFIFNQDDSLITLTNSPIIWSGDTQLTGDTIKVYLKNNEVYRITLIDDAMIVSPDSSGMYNQIKGLKIDNFVLDKKLTKSEVLGNAELFFMMEENGSYQGINLTKSNSMIFYFKDDEIEKIDKSGQPESNMYPYSVGMDVESYFLDGFVWRIDEKPEDDIFYATIIKRKN